MNKGLNSFLYATHKQAVKCSNNVPTLLAAELQGSGT